MIMMMLMMVLVTTTLIKNNHNHSSSELLLPLSSLLVCFISWSVVQNKSTAVYFTFPTGCVPVCIPVQKYCMCVALVLALV